MTYSKDTLRQIFQQPFNETEWQRMLQHYFHATELKAAPERIEGTEDDEQGYYLGAIDTIDSYRIGLFYYQIRHGNVARKRVGLRNLVKSLVNPNLGDFDAALVVFDSSELWRLSFVCDIKGENTAAKRYTYVFGETDNYYNTPVGRFDALQRNGISFENIKDAFSVERLNKEFFDGYKKQYNKFLATLSDGKKNRDYVKKLLGRIVFLHFLQKKGWMGVPASNPGWEGGDRNYLANLINRYNGNDRLLSDVLEPLFFNTLNEKRENDIADSILGDNIKIPYLNGGLFEKDSIDRLDIDFPYSYFKELMEFFSMYNFTIDENDPDDSEVGIDPEMLGHIFENLLEDNKDKGAFYTPKEIVQYMCRQSVIQYLKTHEPEEQYADAIEQLINKGIVLPIIQTKETATQFTQLLKNVKVCDPAIGSGAFPMGILHVLYHAIHHLHSHTKPNGDFNSTQIKRDIIQNNIFGVDIEQGAVDIARLRFWLALVVDAEEPQPLPNLDYKITCGNSQICRYSLDTPIDNVFDEYNRVGKENAKKNKTIWEDYTLEKYKQDVVKYTEEHSDKIGLRAKINEIKNCFKITLAIKDLKKKQKAAADVHNYEFVDFWGKCKAKEDPIGYEKAKKTLLSIVEEENRILNNKKYKDSFEWRFEYPQLLDDNGTFTGFDIIIANPPYIKEGRMSKTFFEPYKDSPYYKGKMDIWYIFACNGLDLLNSNGILCFIATNNWVTSFGASKLRDKVIKETRICNIVDFGSVMMFESASIQTMIMMFQKDKVTDDYTFDYRKLTAYRATEKEAIAILDKSYKEYSQAECYTPTIRRANFYGKNITFSQSDGILDRIYNVVNKIFLAEYELTNGIHPHYDFINKRLSEKYGFPIGKGIFGLSKVETEALKLTEAEAKFIKPYYNSSDNVDRYKVGATELNIIYTPSTFKNPHSMDSYPNLKAHLDIFKDVISSDNKPYGLHRARVESFFVGEKIVALRKCAGKPVFAYANGENYMSATFYVIKTERVNMKYLTGLLNSKLIEFWLKNKGKMQGANYQLDKEPLQQIPIAVPSKEVQEIIGKLVDIIILLSNTENRVSNLVQNSYISSELETLIDGCVYEIYFPKEMQDIPVISTLRNYVVRFNSINISDIWELYKKIDSTGIIDSINLLSLSKLEILRTIILS